MINKLLSASYKIAIYIYTIYFNGCLVYFANSKSEAKLAQHRTIPHKKINQGLTDISQF